MYGTVTNNWIEKLAYSDVGRWNDNIKRHTIYTVGDSSQDMWGFWKGNRPTVTGSVDLKIDTTVPFDAAVGAQVSQQLFNWVPISYPANYISLTPQIVDTVNLRSMTFANIVTWGATDLKSRIESTPGTFALVGYGVGAMVCSAALQEMQQQSSSLSSRMGDCVAAVMFSNPCRQESVTYPGGADPGGAGILPFASTGVKGMIRNTDTPEWWWEMVTADDPASTCPIDTSGQAVNVVAEALLNVTNIKDFRVQLAKIPAVFKRTNAVWPLIAARLTNRTANAAGQAWAERVLGINPPPHTLYSYSAIPALPTDVPGLAATSTYLDAAVAYINLRGTTISPR